MNETLESYIISGYYFSNSTTVLLCSVPSHTLVSSMPSTHSQSEGVCYYIQCTCMYSTASFDTYTFSNICSKAFRVATAVYPLLPQYIDLTVMTQLPFRVNLIFCWLVWAEIECTVHVATLSTRPINQFTAKLTTGAKNLLC